MLNTKLQFRAIKSFDGVEKDDVVIIHCISNGRVYGLSNYRPFNTSLANLNWAVQNANLRLESLDQPKTTIKELENEMALERVSGS
jgi:hypothetical protein